MPPFPPRLSTSAILLPVGGRTLNILEKIRFRREARKSLKLEQRAYVDRISAEIWSDTGDIGEAMRVTELKVNTDAQSMGFDPATILMLVQLALIIYKALKALNVLSPSPDYVTSMFREEDK